VALKFLTEARLDDRSRARFHREAQLSSSVTHPNVVALHDVGEHDGLPYLATELLQGQTLRELISAGSVPWRQAVVLVEQVTEGLAATHAKGIVHRDLKPENLFLTTAGQVKILDFGVARLVDAGPPGGGNAEAALTASGTTVGTPAYMSPEQLRLEPVDLRSDLFSLGCVLYEILAGRRPFQAKTAILLGYAVCHQEPEALPSELPQPLTEVVLRCLQKQPGDRFQTAQELRGALQTLLSCSPPLPG
jgi:serine/threonine-protein kinase